MAGIHVAKIAHQEMETDTWVIYPLFPHLAAAAFLAIALRCAFVIVLALAFPPAFPPWLANALRSAAVFAFIDALPPSEPNATAAGFFFAIVTQA